MLIQSCKTEAKEQNKAKMIKRMEYMYVVSNMN